MTFERIPKSEMIPMCEKLDKKTFTVSTQVVSLPERSTSGSAGYDFRCPFDVVIKKGKTVSIPLLVRCVDMPDDTVLLMFNRSGLSLKFGLMLDNAVGVIDSDYRKCIWAQITNHGKKTYYVHANDKICQGIFVKYCLAEGDDTHASRDGGFGSTGK